MQVENILGYTFKNKKLLFLAFIHRSYANEHKEIQEHNERLEFLGDSVLGLVIGEFLYSHLPTWAEGELSEMRARLVDAGSCKNYFNKLRLEKYIFLGKGELLNAGRGKESILSDVFEALIGAIYLDGGWSVVREFIHNHFQPLFLEAIEKPSQNFKAELQDYSQKKHQKPPLYRILKEEGPDHAKIFHVSVTVGDSILATGIGNTKKEAEQMAAGIALQKIKEING